MSGKVQATEIPNQIPEDDWVLAEELVGVDHLVGHGGGGQQPRAKRLTIKECRSV